MPGESATDVARAGRRIQKRVLAALVLAAVLPLLVLAFVVLVLLLPTLGPGETLKFAGLQMLLLFTLIGMAAGVWVIWDLARVVVRLGMLLAGERVPTGVEHRQDDVGVFLAAFGRMAATLKQQDAETNTFATRLDAAYKELESTNARLKETSFKDEVTGLYNRRFFSLRLEEELSRYRRFNHPVSVVLLDLDGFKAVNDEFGHTVGDETLREIAQILMKHSRGINVVSRYGGDEFAVLLVETSKAGARLYADRIREVVAKYPFSHGKVITSSFGVASLPDDEAGTAEDLYRAADEALYAAKRAGKNQVAATPSPQRVP
jgi:diguanylate cyclase (GGDEF)-like protein